MKIAAIFGTRPEAIKLAPVILALRDESWCQCHVCVTGQHRQMLDQVLEVFDIKPDADLNLMQPNQTLGGLTARAIEALDGYMRQERPDLVLVQGDTTTVFCATLAAFYQKIPVGHVEAGLRTGNLQSPWPEEANRVLTTRLAALHFAPTQANRLNLLKEGVPDDRIFVTGNTVIDALFLALKMVRQHPPHIPGLPDFLQPAKESTSRMVLITGHRRENFGEGLRNICEAIAQLAQDFPATHFVFPVHLNPNVRDPVRRILSPGQLPNLHLIEPLPYIAFVALMDRSSLILTDSGGVQEEAPSLNKTVLVTREVTERPEALDSGHVSLVGLARDRIVRESKEWLRSGSLKQRVKSNPYGDGRAAARIVDACRHHFDPS